MAWFSKKVSLGNLDFAGAVNKLSESVKNIEKNFDSALGLEGKSDADAAAEVEAAASDSEGKLFCGEFWSLVAFCSEFSVFMVYSMIYRLIWHVQLDDKNG